MTQRSLFDPVQVGRMALPNRVVMAPLTRNRALGQVAQPAATLYYGQRAHPKDGAGLIITEGTPVDAMAHGYADTPGISSPEQIAAWKAVTEAVHQKGSSIVVQLWHVGRVSHSDLLPGGAAPVSASAIRAKTRTYVVRNGMGSFVETSEPRALRLDELPAIVESFAQAARHAIDAGFDGVEIHGANGYLFEQFLKSGANQRTDAYGGTIENRCRLLLETVDAVVAAIGADRTGLRLSPVTPVNDIVDAEPQALYMFLLRALARHPLAFLHIIEGHTGGPREIADQPFDYTALRHAYREAGGTAAWMVNNGYDRALADAAVANGADLVAFGRTFIANPDLTRRLREGAPLNTLDKTTLYGGGSAGYTDYPALA